MSHDNPILQLLRKKQGLLRITHPGSVSIRTAWLQLYDGFVVGVQHSFLDTWLHQSLEWCLNRCKQLGWTWTIEPHCWN